MRNHYEWEKNKKKKSRNFGEAYTTSKGETVRLRAIQNPWKSCGLKYSEKISYDQCHIINKNYWQLWNDNHRREYLIMHMTLFSQNVYRWVDDLQELFLYWKILNIFRFCTLPGITFVVTTKFLYIYDSVNPGKLTKELEFCLRPLFPYIDLKPMKFPGVQNQNNCMDCGVFSVAYMISLICIIKPDKVRYNQILMRPHSIKMF